MSAAALGPAQWLVTCVEVAARGLPSRGSRKADVASSCRRRSTQRHRRPGLPDAATTDDAGPVRRARRTGQREQLTYLRDPRRTPVPVAPPDGPPAPGSRGRSGCRTSTTRQTRTSSPPSSPSSLTCGWVSKGEPLCLIGDSGTGKSHLLIGLGATAAMAAHRWVGPAARFRRCRGWLCQVGLARAMVGPAGAPGAGCGCR